jgi:catechol 2,3-dioxygenase-like lactoylglutathione lyase family enzyme
MVAVWVLAGCGPRPAESTLAHMPAEGASTVVRVGYTVHDLDRVVAFFRQVLDFELLEESLPSDETAPNSLEAKMPRTARLLLGAEKIELTQYAAAGRPIPEDSASNDLWFEHLAIVVSDMDRAYQRLAAHGVFSVTTGRPQTIPMSNPAAGGIRAFYFEDPEGHVLELIWYPEGKRSERWLDQRRLFLGIDHTAIAVSNTDRSLAFYEGVLGFEKAGESFNHGPEQEALSGVDGARVRITGLVGEGGMGIELLEYLEPGPGRRTPLDTRLEDAWHWEISIASPRPDLLVHRAGAAGAVWNGDLLRDPDQHAVRVLASGAGP